MSKEEIIGTYRKNQKGFGFVKIEDQEDEIYISRENSKNALNGDTVAIKIIAEKEGDKKQEGKIVKIVRHEKDTVVGTFQKSRNFAFVVPDDKNFGTDIFISKANWGKARDKKKVLVQILKYPEKGKNAEGKVIEVLGGINEAGVDMLSLIKQYELPYKFPDEVVAEAKAYGDKIDPSDLPRRRDLRNDIIFTIDGEDAKDLDDAIHVEKLENGNYKLDVHIADVSHYVREKTELDKEAYLRGTSIYMLGRVIPMLPRELSNGICSLNAGEDRYTLSCSMEITPKAKIVSSDIYKGVIRVTERMCYTDVQKILDRSDETVLKRYEKYISYFDLMAELANILKAKRKENGYLNLEIPESKIILDENGVAIDVKKYETYFANEIIEQFMLIANETVAEKFYWLQAPFIYRNHEAPDVDKVKELNKSLQQELNPPREGEPEKASMGVIFRIGDRIMQTKNNYDMYWERREGDSIETGNGVFNGEIGTITNINEKEKNIRIKFDDDKVCWYEFNDLEQIDHSYCITIHKAQGSEFDVVIMIVPQAAPMLLTRNLLYTGLTRAKKLLIVIGNDRVVDFMINNVDSKKRNTGLEYKLKNT